MSQLEIMGSIQRALLGNVTPNLRAVYVKIENELIQLILFYDRTLSEKENELADFIDTEFISDFPSPNYKTSFNVIILPYPTPFPKVGLCAYKRFEKGLEDL
jgi:hypothetical protein